MRLLWCIVFSCLLFVAGAKHLGRQGYEQHYVREYPQQGQIEGQYGKSYNYYNNYNLPQLQQRQKFLLDVLLQVQRPVENAEIIQLGDRLITESSYYTEANNKYLLEFFEQCKQGKFYSHQFVGLYHFFVLARDYETFQRNVAYARIYMDPYVFVTALQLAVRDRYDCRDLVFPALYEILPEYFFDRSVIDSARTIDYSVLSNGVSSMKPSLFNLIGVSHILGGFPFNLLHKPMISQKYSQVDSKIILGDQNEQQITYLTDDVGLNTFWNNIIAERQLQCVTGRRQQSLEGQKYHYNYYYGQDNSQYHDDYYNYQQQQYSPYHNQYAHPHYNVKNSRDELRQDYSNYGRVGLEKQYNQGIGGYTKYSYENILGNKYNSNKDLPEASIDSDRLLHVNRRRYEQKYGDQQQYYQQKYGNQYDYQHKYGQQYDDQYNPQENSQEYGDYQQYNQLKYGQQSYDQYYPQKYGQKYDNQGKNYQQYYQGYEQGNYNKDDDQYYSNYLHHLFGKNIIGEGHKVEQYKSHGEDYNQYLYKGKQQGKYYDQYKNYYGSDQGEQDQNLKYAEKHQYGQNYPQDKQGQYYKYDKYDKEGQRDYFQYGKYDKQGQRDYHQYGKYDIEGQRDYLQYGKYDKEGQKDYQKYDKEGQRDYLQYGKYDKEGKQYYNQQSKFYGQYYDYPKYIQQQQDQIPYGKYYGQQNQYPIVDGDRLMQGRYPRSVEGRYQQQKYSSPYSAQHLMAYRSGEIFIQNLRQLIARINLENLALKLEQQQGQQFELGLQMTRNGVQYYQGHIENRQYVDQSIDKAIYQLRSIINDELKRRQINENSEGVFHVLTDVLMNYSEQYNSNVWDYIYNNIVRDIYRAYNQEQSSAHEYYLYGAQYLNQPIRNLRDPIYIEIVYKLVQFINEYTRQIEQYDAKDLMYNDVTIKDIKVDRLVTYTQQHDYDLINLVDEQLTQDKLERIQSKVVVRQERLNHQPFTISYELQAQKPQRVVVRTLLGPKYNERQELVSLEEDRDKFIVLDAYVQDLTIGDNYIERSSQQIAHYSGRTVTTLSEIYKRVLYGKSFEDLISDQGRYPDYLLLPRGTSQGLPMQLLVVITPLVDQYYQENIDYRQIYGLGIYSLHLDNLPLNYPLDRDMQISEQEFIQYPNVYLKDVEIVHKYDY